MNDEVEAESVDMVIENPFVGESKANGPVENAIKRTQGQVRIVRTSTDDFFGIAICFSFDIWQWFVEFCADTFNRYKIGRAGAMPYKRIKGREPTAPVVVFGKQI